MLAMLASAKMGVLECEYDIAMLFLMAQKVWIFLARSPYKNIVVRRSDTQVLENVIFMTSKYPAHIYGAR